METDRSKRTFPYAVSTVREVGASHGHEFRRLPTKLNLHRGAQRPRATLNDALEMHSAQWAMLWRCIGCDGRTSYLPHFIEHAPRVGPHF